MFPFMSVMSNIMRFVGRRVPVVQDFSVDQAQRSQLKLFSKFRGKSPAEQEAAAGQIALTAAITMWAMGEASKGNITGNISNNSKVLGQLREQGVTPNSIILDGQSVDISRLEPVSTMLIMSASVQQALTYARTEEERQELVSATLNAFSSYVDDKTFMRGFAEFIHAWSPKHADGIAETKAWMRYLTGMAESMPGAAGGPLAPNTPMMRHFRQLIDPQKRSTRPDPTQRPAWQMLEETVNRILSGTPYCSEDLPGHANFWGIERYYPHHTHPDDVVTWMPANQTPKKFSSAALKAAGFEDGEANALMVMGARIGVDWDKAKYLRFVREMGVAGEFIRLGAPVGDHPRNITPSGRRGAVGTPVKLNAAQDLEYRQIMNFDPRLVDGEGRQMKEALDHLITTEAYIRAPDQNDAPGSKADILRGFVNKFRKGATQIFFSRHPELLAKSRQELQDLMEQVDDEVPTEDSSSSEVPGLFGNRSDQ